VGFTAQLLLKSKKKEKKQTRADIKITVLIFEDLGSAKIHHALPTP
jgi:hypothetical protein